MPVHVYDQLALTYDQARRLDGPVEARWLTLLARHLRLGPGARVLDLGCGTGRFSQPLAERLACRVVGLDLSMAMLSQARSKAAHGLSWLAGRAELAPCASGAFDACLASYILHHVGDVRATLAEVFRVLRPAGRLGIRLSSHAQLRQLLDYRFFPSALALDLARTPDAPSVIRLLGELGFTEIESYVVRQPFIASGREHVDKLRRRYTSSLALIPDREFRAGLAAAEVYFRHTPAPRDAAYKETTFLLGSRPA